MNIHNVKFVISAVSQKQYPSTLVPEVAFIGRSNAGKSSLLNVLLNRRKIAKVSGTPGKTRQINFFNIDEELYFADLPGYGFASVSKSEKASWGDNIETYLGTRKQLKLLLLLVDIRHKPTGDDKLMFDWLMSREINCTIIATKSDKISKIHYKERLNEIRATLGADENIKIIPYSMLSRNGKDEIWENILSNI